MKVLPDSVLFYLIVYGCLCAICHVTHGVTDSPSALKMIKMSFIILILF